MKWLWKRIQERTSKVALATAATAGAGVLTGAVDTQTALGAVIMALVTVLVPEGQGGNG